MPSGSKPGERRGGRVKGKLNEITILGKDAIAAGGQEAYQFHLKVMRNDLECGVCRGSGKAPYEKDEDTHRRKCVSCGGDGKERIKPETRLHASENVFDRWLPKLKSMEHVGNENKPIQHEHKVKFVD